MFRINKQLSLCALALTLSANVFAQTANAETASPKDSELETSSQAKRNNDIQLSFLRRQVDQNMSVGRAISSIAGHYPQEVVSVVDLALDYYPDKYREIIFAAISAQPSSTEEIVKLAVFVGIII